MPKKPVEFNMSFFAGCIYYIVVVFCYLLNAVYFRLHVLVQFSVQVVTRCCRISSVFMCLFHLFTRNFSLNSARFQKKSLIL